MAFSKAISKAATDNGLILALVDDAANASKFNTPQDLIISTLDGLQVATYRVTSGGLYFERCHIGADASEEMPYWIQNWTILEALLPAFAELTEEMAA